VDTQGAIDELKTMKRELRRLRFQVDGPMRRVVAAMERVIDALLKKLEDMRV
jgi:hypothetical protein